MISSRRWNLPGCALAVVAAALALSHGGKISAQVIVPRVNQPATGGDAPLAENVFVPPSRTVLQALVKARELLKQEREKYDYVVIDSPALLVSDAKVLAKLADGTVLVFNAAVTRRGAAQRAIRELREVNAVIVGCVLFAVQTLKGGYFQEQFKSYREYQKLQLAHSI